MKNFYKIVLLEVGLWLPFVAAATSVPIFESGATWNYKTVDSIGGSDWLSGITTFGDSFSSVYGNPDIPITSSPAAFTNNSSLGQIGTFWESDTTLYLQTTFELNGNLTGGTTLNLAADNGAVVWINEMEVFRDDSGNFTTINPWEYSTVVDNSYFINNGTNKISVIANDYGASTYFDMEILGSVNPVPLPAAAYFFISALGGLVAVKRKQQKA